MDYAFELMDRIGARLSGSPNLDRAVAWTMSALRQNGLANVRQDRWGEFGLGWRQRRVAVDLIEPDAATLVAAIAPWSPSTRGRVSADAVYVRGFNDETGFAPLRGTLRNKIVVLGRAPGPPEVVPSDKPLFDRFTDEQLAEFVAPAPAAPGDDAAQLERAFTAAAFYERVDRFFADEGVRAVLTPTGNNARGGLTGGVVTADWNYTLGMYPFRKDRAARVPLVVVSVESFGRLSRLLERKVPVRVAVDVDVEFTGDRVPGFNVRILAAAGVRPRRTIQLALWTGEEQGLLGSLAWVNRELATLTRADSPGLRLMPEALRPLSGPPVVKPAHARFSALYNLDQGGGRIRGVRVNGNLALIPIFERWIAPLKDLGVAIVSPRGGCGSDCAAFADAGIPTPLFLQDPLEYATRTLHTTADTADHLFADDLKQAAVVVATMLYNTAQRDERLPRR